jgi:hypothetical protein
MIKERGMASQSKVRMRRLFCSSAWLWLVLVVICGSGATCQRPMLVNPFGPAGPAAPQVLAPGASRDQIVAAVNQNSAKIHSISVTGASITIPDMMGLPILSGNIAAERPGRFRLTAGTAITGQEIDLGSNDELFWMWVRRNQPPAVYICRHDQFANSAIRQMMPIEPSWLLAALGIVNLDSAQVFDGPVPHGDGKVELRSLLPSAAGTLHRVTLIDAERAWVVEQHVYDPTTNTLLASAVAESHRYYPLEQVSLPDRITIRLPSAKLALTIALGTVQINQIAGDRQQLWTLPAFDGYPQHDLGGAPASMPVPGRPAAHSTLGAVVPAAFSPYPSTAHPATTTLYPSSNQEPTMTHVLPTSGTAYNPLPRYGAPQHRRNW